MRNMMNDLEAICISVLERTVLNNKDITLGNPVLVERQKELILFGNDPFGREKNSIMVETTLNLGVLAKPVEPYIKTFDEMPYVVIPTKKQVVFDTFYPSWRRIDEDMLLAGNELVYFGRSIPDRRMMCGSAATTKVTEYSVKIYLGEAVEKYFNDNKVNSYKIAMHILSKNRYKQMELF